jgi:hypothetical protein
MKGKSLKKSVRRSYCLHHPLLFVIACGIILFLCSLAFLAFPLHIIRGHASFDKPEKGFFSDQLQRIVEKKRKHKDKENKATTKNTQNSFWQVIAPSGIIIREHKSLLSKFLGKLPPGAVVIRESSVLRNNDHLVGDSSRITTKNMSSPFMSRVINTNSNTDNRIFITYPLKGWVTLSTTPSSGNQFEKRNLLQPLRFKTDLRCSPRFFLDYADLTGGDIGNIEQPLSVSSATACCNACSTTPRCYSWTFTPEKSCWLKDQRAKKVPSDIKLISGLFLSGNKGKIQTNSVGLAGRVVNSKVSALCCTDDQSEKNNMENTSPEILRIKRTTTDWNHQWPIGTGRFGALVGGTIEREVIPFSIAGLFVIKIAEDFRKKNQENKLKNKGEGDHFESKSDAWKAFNRSR